MLASLLNQVRTAKARWLHTWRQRRLNFVSMCDNRRLTPAELQIARGVQQRLRRVFQQRDELNAAGKLDPEIDLPQGIWTENASPGLFSGCGVMMSGDEQTLNHLRLFARAFTGKCVLKLSTRTPELLQGRVPHNCEDLLQQARKQFEPALVSYHRYTSRLPEQLWISPPAVFGEAGWVVRGRLVNHDTTAYLERMVLLHESGILQRLKGLAATGKTVRVLEIGSGYGGLAYYLKQQVANCRYVAVDLPESLIYAGIYLSVLFAGEETAWAEPGTHPDERGRGLTFVPNFLFSQVADQARPFDLVINTLSMSEMSRAQIEHYCLGLRRCLSSTGVFFEQNQDNRWKGHQNAQDVIAKYFPAKKELKSQIIGGLTQGRPHLWANSSTALEASTTRSFSRAA